MLLAWARSFNIKFSGRSIWNMLAGCTLSCIFSCSKRSMCIIPLTFVVREASWSCNLSGRSMCNILKICVLSWNCRVSGGLTCIMLSTWTRSLNCRVSFRLTSNIFLSWILSWNDSFSFRSTCNIPLIWVVIDMSLSCNFSVSVNFSIVFLFKSSSISSKSNDSVAIMLKDFPVSKLESFNSNSSSSSIAKFLPTQLRAICVIPPESL